MAVSLRRRLILILLALTLVTWLVLAVITALLAQQLILRQVERQLNQYMDMAQHTMGIIFDDPELTRYYRENTPQPRHRDGASRLRGFGTQGREQAINIWFDDNHMLIGELAPVFPDPQRDGFITWREQGSHETTLWRILYRHNPQQGNWLAVGVDLDHATGIGAATLLRAVVPLLIILPLTVGILLWGVRRGLRPLDLLARKIEVRQAQALDPIDTVDIPQEIRPVVIALNGLLDRLQRALASEGRFTANAAHELQTPLAAIKAEVQRCQRQVADAQSRVMIERISARVSRATETVTQLLTLARLDPEQEFPRAPVDLHNLVIDAVAGEGGLAMDRGLDVRVPEYAGLLVEGHPDWISILVRNLVANAVKYSTAGSVVEITLEGHSAGIRLCVANDCEPISEEQRQRLAERFYRLPGNTAAGVGLGLSIVARIAELHGARLGLHSWREGRGFVAELVFPPFDG